MKLTQNLRVCHFAFGSQRGILGIAVRRQQSLCGLKRYCFGAYDEVLFFFGTIKERVTTKVIQEGLYTLRTLRCLSPQDQHPARGQQTQLRDIQAPASGLMNPRRGTWDFK